MEPKHDFLNGEPSHNEIIFTFVLAVLATLVGAVCLWHYTEPLFKAITNTNT